ncbi:hypothetical protein [Desulfosporosinus sp. BG]|uniref:hypothetical protein n=1 Tax=Desulfosporosinus sp. BG TaxID=1633135 RepID=UPI00114CE0E3|nr:hypothetical protein [Desulfosporosinus sp. BG]
MDASGGGSWWHAWNAWHAWHRCISPSVHGPSRQLVILQGRLIRAKTVSSGDALTSNVLFEFWTSHVACVNVLSTALIDAILLKCSLS